MASGIHIDKVVADVRECIKELCQKYQTTQVPINDDSIELRQLCTKLEHVLQHGQKEKFTFLGGSKDYWDYFCRCLSSENSRPGYSGIKYAKSLSEVKTSLGRGRAFIRFCLMFRCLPDTLKVCISNAKATTEYYQEWSILLKAEKLQHALSELYDLNAVEFDLAPSGNDLDTAWPSFARKTFTQSWNFPSRNITVTSITNPASEHGDEPSNQNKDAEQSVPSTAAAAVTSVEDTGKPTFQELSCSPSMQELEKQLDKAKAAAAQHARESELCKEEQRHKTELWKIREAELTAKIATLEEARSHVQSTPGGNEHLQDSSSQTTNELLKDMRHLNEENQDLIMKNGFLTRRLNEILEKLEDREESLSASRQSELSLNTKMDKLQMVNEGLKNLVDAVRQENTILRQQSAVMEKEIQNAHILLEQKKAQCKCLDDELMKLRSKCCEAINCSALRGKEIDRLVTLLRGVQQRLDARATSEDAEEEAVSKGGVEDLDICDNYGGAGEQSVLCAGGEEVGLRELRAIVEQYSSKKLLSSDSELYEHCLRYLTSALLQQEALIEKSSAKVKDLCSATHSINLQLHVLREVLSMKPPNDAKQSDVQPVSLDVQVEELSPPRIEGCDFVTTLFETLCRNRTKLHGLIQAEYQLDIELADCRELNKIVSSKVHEQERKLCGFVQELERTRVLLTTMEGTHQKLQTAKAVMRYELQEKKHMLRRLKEQLESTREDSVRVRRSNAESEIEWKSLREEFHSRKKQDSQDSGLSDACHSSREQSPSSGEDTSEKDDPESIEDVASIAYAEVDNVPHSFVADIEERSRIRSQRLEHLEQQCRIIYNSLIRSSERSNALQRRLQSLLRGNQDDLSPSSSSSDDDVTAPLVAAELHNALGVISEEGAAVAEDGLLTDYDSDAEETSQDDSLPEIRKKTLDTVVQRVKMEKSKNEELIASLRTTIAELQQANENLSLQVSQMAEENQHREREMRERASGMLKAERCLKSVQHQEVIKERDALLEKHKELEVQLMQKEMQLLEMEKSKNKCLEERKNLENEVHVLVERLDQQESAHDHMQQNFVIEQALIKEMKEKIGEQEKSMAELEQSLVQLREARVMEQTHFCREVEELQLTMASREEECINLAGELRKLRAQADQDRLQSEQLKKELATCKETLTMADTQLKQLRLDSVELRKQIVRLVKEKDSLWKQNDSLQYLQRLQATDKWMDNNETNQCLQCSSVFTLTMRKHHCRLCGRIFCHSCSNNWLMTTASSRPTRVCDECNVRHNQLMRDTRSESICSTMITDSDEEATSLTEGQLQKSSNTDIPLKRRSSAHHVSKKTTAVLCSSAPALHSASPLSMPKISRNWSFPRLRRQRNHSNSCNDDDKQFDIISDEEIARSLSACSPYNSSLSFSTDITFHQSMCRTADDIAARGVAGYHGELWVNAGASCGIPIQLDAPGTILRWEFTSDPRTISFEMKYRRPEADVDALDTILPPVSIEARTEPAEGQLVVRDAGVYVLVFNNQHSKFTAKKISYKLEVQKPSSADEKVD